MKFSDDTYEKKLKRPVIIFKSENLSRVVLLDMLNLFVNDQDGVTIHSGESDSTDNGNTTGVLYCMSTELPVGIIADDFVESGMFGILASDRCRASQAESLGEKIDLLTCANYKELLHS